MFKKLRVKFIAITMVMVALVMAFAFTAACITEYQRSTTVVQTALSDAVENALSLKDREQHRPGDDGQSPPPRRDSRSVGDDADASNAQETGESSSGEPGASDGAASSESSSGSAAATAEASSQPASQKGLVSMEGAKAVCLKALAGVLKAPLAYAAQEGSDRESSAEGQPGLSAQAAPQGEGSRTGAPVQPDSGAGGSGGQQSGQDAARESQRAASAQPDGPDQTGQPDAESQQGEQAGLSGEDANRAQLQSQETLPDDEEAVEEEDQEQSSEQAAGSAAQGQDGSAAQTAEGAASEGSVATSETAPEEASQTGESLTLDNEGDAATAPPVIGNRDGRQRTSSSLVPVAVYSVSDDGTMHMVPQVTSASMSDDVLLQAAQRALECEDGYGTFDDLQLNYFKRSADGTTYIAFADTSYTDSWKSLALTLLVAGLITLAIFFIVCLFYSRWALRPVSEAWDSQRQFVADASHDLKTPLTVILANASILLKHPDHSIASESQWIESTQKEAEDMQGLVNEMLELASIEAGEKVEVVRDPIDFSDLVDGETLLFDSVALERSCEFDCSIEEGISVLGNEGQVKKMVSTLVENAFKYVDDAGTVDIRLSRSGKNAVLAIRNTGSVIADEDLPHIFDRFYRTDKARTSGTGGFGLGLAIAREVALQHGGDITCASDAEKGTTFTVTLPTV